MKKKPFIHPDMLVSELLSEWPQTIPVFLRHKMACVGCSMSGFETLSSAAQVYGISPDIFLDELNRVIDNGSSHRA